MAAPDFVPTDPTATVRVYSSPPRRPESWTQDRAGEITDGQPSGVRLGSQGPDQGYALKLLHLFDDKLECGALHRADVEAGCAAVAMKRSALFGRGPVVHDLTAAFTIFGFLDPSPDAELVALREELFPEVGHTVHYAERRRIVDLVADDVLHQSHGAIATAYGQDWRKNLSL